MSQTLHHITNIYTVLNGDKAVGTITFIKYTTRPHEWLIQDVYGNMPVTVAHHNSKLAMQALKNANLTWKSGKNKKYYLYQ